MKNRSLKLLTGTAILATLLLSGCGGGADNSITKQPHDTSKLGRTVSLEKDWTWDVSFSTHVAALNDTTDETFVEAHFWEGLPDNIKNFQIFLDMDNDTSTGYSGPDGWEIHGADYLIENGEVYRSLSTTEWKWASRGKFERLLSYNRGGFGKYEFLRLSKPTPTLSRIFTSNNFKVMIEVYDKNWEGDCNTITGIVADVTGVDTGDDDTNTTGSTNEKKVLVSKSVDKDNDGVIDSKTSYKYDSEGRLVEFFKLNSPNNKTEFKYDSHGNVIEKKSTNNNIVYTSYFVNTYNDAGKLIKMKQLFGDINNPDNVEITEYDLHGNVILFDNDIGIARTSYVYADDGRILQSLEDNDADGYVAKLLYIYDTNNQLSHINIDFTEDGVLQYSRVFKEFTYYANGKVHVEKKYWGAANDVTTETTTFVYDDDADLIQESTDFTSDGVVDHNVFNTYKTVTLPN